MRAGGVRGQPVLLAEPAHRAPDPRPALDPAHAFHDQVGRRHAQHDDFARGQVALLELEGAFVPLEHAVDDLLHLLGDAVHEVLGPDGAALHEQGALALARLDRAHRLLERAIGDEPLAQEHLAQAIVGIGGGGEDEPAFAEVEGLGDLSPRDCAGGPSSSRCSSGRSTAGSGNSSRVPRGPGWLTRGARDGAGPRARHGSRTPSDCSRRRWSTGPRARPRRDAPARPHHAVPGHGARTARGRARAAPSPPPAPRAALPRAARPVRRWRRGRGGSRARPRTRVRRTAWKHPILARARAPLGPVREPSGRRSGLRTGRRRRRRSTA